jgi:(1->4)-alpha-D-glucan 1-alpha-D-glucosylmutase
MSDEQWPVFRERIESYMLKAAREAKSSTSWINQNAEYESALTDFVRALLTRDDNPFLDDFLPFQRRIAYLGLLNSLSAALIKLTAPGVPDVYQGNELWDFSLVDPDNRRPVDYETRRIMLDELKTNPPYRDANALTHMLANLPDGCSKLYLIWRALWLRQKWPEIFLSGEYFPLAAEGERASHLCAFARHDETSAAITIVPRWFAGLVERESVLPLGEAVWHETFIAGLGRHERYVNVLTGETITAIIRDGKPWLRAADLLAKFPVVLLVAGNNLSVLDV